MNQASLMRSNVVGSVVNTGQVLRGGGDKMERLRMEKERVKMELVRMPVLP